MTKQQLLLTLIKDCVNWGEGADFEMSELIHGQSGPVFIAIKQHYPQFWNNSEEEDLSGDPDNGRYSYEFYRLVRADMNALLEEANSKTIEVADKAKRRIDPSDVADAMGANSANVQLLGKLDLEVSTLFPGG